MPRWLFSLLAAVTVLAALGLPARATAQVETAADFAVLMDADTGEVFFEKRADELMQPASMTKLMTMVMLFEALENGTLALDDEILISVDAWRRGGAGSGSSTMFAEVNSKVPVESIIRGVIVQSGNDASIAIADTLAGSEEAFAARMTSRARELGLAKATFRNATGWPDPEHLMTARELAKLARYLIETFPQYYKYYAETEFTWNGIRQLNRNPLLHAFDGADGLKTGHTDASGYGLVGSAMRDGRRIIMVMNGLPSERARAREASRLMQTAFSDFVRRDLVAADTIVGTADVARGAVDSVPLAVGSDVSLLLHRRALGSIDMRIRYTGPLIAPLPQGADVGELIVRAPGMTPRRYALYTAEPVPETGFLGKVWRGLVHLVTQASETANGEVEEEATVAP